MSDERIRGMNSPLGRLQFAKDQQKKVLTVEDTTAVNEDIVFGNDDKEELARLEAIRKEKFEAKNKASPMAVSRLEILTGIGRLSRDVKIDNVVFTLRSLKGREMREVMVATANSNISVFEQAFELRAQQLARAITKIDGHPIDLVLGDGDLANKIAFIQEMDEQVLSKLHSEYSAMITENNKNLEELGKTPEEVVDTVKKS